MDNMTLTQDEAYEQAPALLAEALADEYSDDPEDYDDDYEVTDDSVDELLTRLNLTGTLYWSGKVGETVAGDDIYPVVQQDRVQVRPDMEREGMTIIDTGDYRIVHLGGF